MAVQIQIRRGIGTDWDNTNPILADGEIAYDKTSKQLKIGDGSSSWITLPYFNPAVSGSIGITTQVTELIIAGVATAQRFSSTVATGTAPLSVASSTVNTNLNADFLDGQHGSYYQNASNINAGTLDSARLPSTISVTNIDASSGVGTFGSLTVTGFSTFANTYATGISSFGSNIKLDSSTGIITATSYQGSGTQLTGIVTSIVAGLNVSISTSFGQVTITASGGGGEGGGIGTPLSSIKGEFLNSIYKTQKISTTPSNSITTIASDASSGFIAFTTLDGIIVSTGSTLIVSTGTTFIMNVVNIF